MSDSIYLNLLLKEKKVRWTYIRTKCRIRKGLIATFVDTDEFGKPTLWVGWSITNVNSGDRFNFQLGVAYALAQAVPYNVFVQQYEEGLFPRLPKCWKNVRDENGKVTGEIEWYDQWEVLVSQISETYEKLVEHHVLADA